MSTLLYPMTVSAKVITQKTSVPSLTGAPFNRDATLEAGIHLHWALPDALTAATVLSGNFANSIAFPAVPDLWLVVRFNPGASSSTPLAKRSWSAWVIDSIAQTSTPLSQWTPPQRRGPSMVHTIAGLLPDASSAGYAGSGLWNADPAAHTGSSPTFDPAAASYYPEARKRFGFYDSVQDLGKGGNVSYLVVGWFGNSIHDPLTIGTLPSSILNAWNATTTASTRSSANVTPQVNLGSDAAPAAAWTANINVTAAQPPSASQLLALQHVAAQNGTADARKSNLATMTASFPAPDKPAAGSTYVKVSAADAGLIHPVETILHGAVMSVPLGGAPAPAALTGDNVKLYPNVKRALADISVNLGIAGLDSAAQVDGAEMLLGDLGAQKFTTGGVLDMPGAAHAGTFQSVPGKPKTYARIDIEAAMSLVPYPCFTLMPNSTVTARGGSGYWPEMQTRSASETNQSRISTIPGLQLMQPTAPSGPSDKAIADFLVSFRKSFDTAVKAAAAKGITMDPRLLRVNDSRTNARSASLGVTPDGSGSDAAGWWIDITDDDALATLLKTTVGAVVSQPSELNLFQLPGPRWYRSWSPQVVLRNVGRSYKFGFDTRFRSDKKVQTRLSGNTLVSLGAGTQPAVFGADLVLNPQNLNVPGVPSVAKALVRETLLLDTESVSLMASLSGSSNQAAAKSQYTAAIQGLWFARHFIFDSTSLHSVSLTGEAPSPLAITPWQDPVDPLLLDTNYSHAHNDMGSWTLDEGAVEMTPVPPPAGPVPVLPVEVFSERSRVTATIPSVLQSALVSRTAVDMLGNPAPAQKVDPSLTEDTFTQMNLISAPLTQFDSQLTARKYRLRAGALRLNKLQLVDMYGIPRCWNSGVDPTSPDGDAASPFYISLPPRLPYWSRFNFRLTAADVPGKEADAVHGPVCGLLLPDFLEHALEVFDSTGKGLGQLTSDRPVKGQTSGGKLQVTYTPHEWLDPNPDPLFHISNPTLKLFVQSLLQQGIDVPAGSAPWTETGLSAMLRTIDTIRGTFDPASKTADRKISLVGEPILLLGGRLQFNGTATEESADLTRDPVLLTDPPRLPALQVRIGDVTRPDDGVLGLFIPPTTPTAGSARSSGHFAPVCKQAADQALLNVLSTGPSPSGWQAVTHPFVSGQESKVSLPANQPVDVVILTDIRNAIYLTCGALPRKKITIPKEFIDPAIQAFEPSFYAGPILTAAAFDSEKSLLPPPDVAGYTTQFLYKPFGAAAFSSTDVPATSPLGDLPPTRVVLTEGWLRMVPLPPPGAVTP